jgi:hypothetical protein
MPTTALPCCASAEAQHRENLPHVRQFDLDLYQCSLCSRYWVYAWRAGRDGWEAATAHDAERMQTLTGTELRMFLRAWALSFG